MTIRGGGDPSRNTVIEPFVRMGRLPRSLTSEAHGCFMVRTHTGPTEYKVAARGSRALAGSPRIVCYPFGLVGPNAAMRSYCYSSRDEINGRKEQEH